MLVCQRKRVRGAARVLSWLDEGALSGLVFLGFAVWFGLNAKAQSVDWAFNALGWMMGLNPRQPESQSGTLPTELHPPLKP